MSRSISQETFANNIAFGESIDSKLYRCAVCGSGEIRHWFRLDFGAIGRCGKCGQVLQAGEPQRDAHVTLHQTSDLHETTYALLSELASDGLPFYGWFLDLFEKKAAGGSLLDVGCGVGEFLKSAAERGLEVVGIEVIAELREKAELALGKESIEPRPIEEAEFAQQSFDAITMWDVIEHLIDPGGALARIHQWLKPGGYLGVATLNHASLMYLIYHALRRTCPPLARPFGSRLYNPFHTYYFTKQSLARLVENAGFEVIEHRGYEFPLSRLDASAALKFGMRGLYLLQGIAGMQGEQYLLARKR